jgi:hypothetical protein
MLGRVDPTTLKLSAVLGVGEELVRCAHHESRMREPSISDEVSGVACFDTELMLNLDHCTLVLQ